MGVPAISVASGTLIITGTTADIGSAGSPFGAHSAANLGGVTGTGHLFLKNTGALLVNGDVVLTAGGVATTTVIATASPLTISANMSFVGDLALTAGDNSGVAGDTLTVTKNVTATGNIALQAGDGIVLSGGIISTTLNVSVTANHEADVVDAGDANISQTGTAGIHAANLTASASTGISLLGSNNVVSSFTASNTFGSGTPTGNINLTNGPRISACVGADHEYGTGRVDQCYCDRGGDAVGFDFLADHDEWRESQCADEERFGLADHVDEFRK